MAANSPLLRPLGVAAGSLGSVSIEHSHLLRTLDCVKKGESTCLKSLGVLLPFCLFDFHFPSAACHLVFTVQYETASVINSPCELHITLAQTCTNLLCSIVLKCNTMDSRKEKNAPPPTSNHMSYLRSTVHSVLIANWLVGFQLAQRNSISVTFNIANK
jgi:hypothetical protein